MTTNARSQEEFPPTGGGGAPGPPGAPGATGAAGPPGAIGETGADGEQGTPGTSGAAGPAGSAGAMGPAIFMLQEGEPGEQGVPGAQGATGADGAPGTTGSQGPVGPALFLLSEGEDGQAGSPGPPGDAGVAGPPGATGPAGAPVVMFDDSGSSDPGFLGMPLPNDSTLTLGKLQNLNTNRLLGRGGAVGIGSPEEIVIGTNLSLNGIILNASVPPTGPIILVHEEAEEGPQGPPGIPGSDGVTGSPGPAIFLLQDGEQGEPGPPGSTGNTGAPGFNVLKKTADQTINSGAGTFIDISGLTFPVVSGSDYAFMFYITFQSAAGATGWKSGVNHPGGTLDFWAGSQTIANGAAGVATHTERHNTAVDDMTLLTTTVTAAVDLNVRIEGRYKCTANGTFAARFANELAANTDIVVQKGSWGWWF